VAPSSTVGPRRGARHPSRVPSQIRDRLERGEIETANLMEQIAIDMGTLLTNSFPELSLWAQELRTPRLLDRMRAGGRVLREHVTESRRLEAGCHRSDTVRAWAAMSNGWDPAVPLEAQLQLAKPFAEDMHFAVREWAWIAVRRAISEQPEEAIHLLLPWTQDLDPNVRRFASEATRPIGVWSRHIRLLRQRPELALPLLDSLRYDQSSYVRKSVGNWLNDAARSRPEWVLQVCNAWEAEVENSEQHRAVRSIKRLATRRLTESEPAPSASSIAPQLNPAIYRPGSHLADYA